jgi:hypothetical protein
VIYLGILVIILALVVLIVKYRALEEALNQFDADYYNTLMEVTHKMKELMDLLEREVAKSEDYITTKDFDELSERVETLSGQIEELDNADMPRYDEDLIKGLEGIMNYDLESAIGVRPND